MKRFNVVKMNSIEYPVEGVELVIEDIKKSCEYVFTLVEGSNEPQLESVDKKKPQAEINRVETKVLQFAKQMFADW